MARYTINTRINGYHSSDPVDSTEQETWFAALDHARAQAQEWLAVNDTYRTEIYDEDAESTVYVIDADGEADYR